MLNAKPHPQLAALTAARRANRRDDALRAALRVACVLGVFAFIGAGMGNTCLAIKASAFAGGIACLLGVSLTL